MATGTYGEPGKNSFTVKGVGGILSPVVNSSTGITQVYKQGALNRFQSLGTLDPKTGKFSADSKAGLSQAEIKSLSNQEGINNIKNAAKTATIKGIESTGTDSQSAQNQANKLLSPNSGNPESQETKAALDNDIKSTEKSSRFKFPEKLTYPANLQTEFQDIMKFNMLKYEPRSLNESANQGLGSFGERSKFSSRTIGSVFLPIPGGISDTNAVTWGSDSLPAGAKALADLANSIITGGGEGGASTLERQTEQAQQSSGEIKKGVAAFFTEQAIGQSNILSRTQGAIQNPNMELLFSAPSLRPFSFTFKLSARSVADREQIRKIIRFFKQGMAVQRTESQLFLKAPHTFKIQYLHKNKDHPYINQIKECALQSFTVNYTPEGNYMTFADGLMTSYEITMQFQELEPIFNDDYSKLDGDNDSVIGY